MANTHNVAVMEVCRVGPPRGSVPSTSLPLTYFDAMWLQTPPIHRLFFYPFSQHSTFTTTHFVSTLLPNLKHSLSFALRLFFPLAANLTLSSTTGLHEILYLDGDAISVTISQSDADFHRLASKHPREAAQLSPLLPDLLPIPDSQSQNQPLLAVQLTLFPESGICLGTSHHHVAADGNSYFHFMKSWASICRSGEEVSLPISAPSHDRSGLAHLDGLKRLILDQMASCFKIDQFQKKIKPSGNVLLATFVLRRADIDKLRQRVEAQQAEHGCRNKPLRCSAFVLATAYLLVCKVGSSPMDGDRDKIYFCFPADCRARLDSPIPSTYFGNCVSMRLIEARVSYVGGEDGIRQAVEVIGGEVEALNGGVLKGAEDWVPKIASLAGERMVLAAGSNKLPLYETDFGWGRPITVNNVSIARTVGICLGESRDEEGGIEINVAFPEGEMERFASSFEEGLKHPSL